MKALSEVYGDRITGSISGWDHLRFRGTRSWLASAQGLGTYLNTIGIRLKQFGSWADHLTTKVRKACTQRAEELGIPMIYLRKPSVDKEAEARRVAQERGVDTGNICMFSVVEPCYAPSIRGNRATQHLELEMGLRQCVHIYQYWNDPILGFGHTRLQSWLPLTATLCINGRHWLERQLLRAGVAYVKDGNCFPFIADLQKAQALLDEQLQVSWTPLLNELLTRNCPIIHDLLGDVPVDYYWSACETEWASDIVFRSARDLDQLFPSLLRYGLVTAQSPEVMRFLGRKIIRGRPAGSLPNEVGSDLRRRYEGMRLKHRVNGNAVKMYNKAGNLLRVETTITQPNEFKVYRRPHDDQSRPASWQRMRKGVCDLHRRAQVSQACNQRYSEHLAAATISETLEQTAKDICSPVTKDGRHYRALNPWAAADYHTLQFIARGETQINGFRNRDLCGFLFGDSTTAKDPDQRRKISGRVTRRLRLLRAHGLIKKVSRTHRYVLTAKGRKVTNAILAASSVDTQKLMDMVA